MKKKKENLNYLLITIVVFSLIAVVYISTRSNGDQNVSYTAPSYAPSQPTKERIYRSKTLKFSIVIPSIFQIEEKFTTILLKNNDKLIQINRSGTNFSTLDDHLDNLSKLNQLTFSDRQHASISNYDSVKGTIGGEIHYFIYVDNWVYSLSTSSPPLFPDLDKIAQSFRYAP